MTNFLYNNFSFHKNYLYFLYWKKIQKLINLALRLLETLEYLFICNRGFLKAISCFFSCSDRQSLANLLCYRFLNPRPVLFPYTTGSKGTLCGTRRVRTLVLQEFKELCDQCTHGCNPTTDGRGPFEMHRFHQQRNNPTPRLGVASAKNANQRD